MDKVLFKYIDNMLVVYIDDIIIFSNTLAEHLNHIQLVFNLLAENNLKLGYEKCEFVKKEIEFVGHLVSHGKYTPLKSRVEAITKLAQPKDVKGI